MKTLNTNIATSSNGTKLVEFKGSNFSSPCYFIIENNKIVSTYETKKAGLMTEGSLLNLRVRKAVNQKYDGNNICTVEQKEFSSAMDIMFYITGYRSNGSLVDNSIVLS